MDRLDMSRTLSRQGNRIAGRQRKKRRQIDRLVREAHHSSPEAVQRRELIRVATRAGRTAVKARAAAELRLIDALNRMFEAGLSIREASDRIGIGYHQARQLLRPGSDAAPREPNSIPDLSQIPDT
jgi:hypothetical protein